jgi:molecular chaperone DnaK (HSP70)
MAKIVGIDFGTTNSLVSVVLSDKVKSYLDSDRMPHPSVVSYQGGAVVAGRDAKSMLVEHKGGIIDNIVRSPKRMLGKEALYVSGREMTPAAVVADLMRHLKTEGEKVDSSDVADFSRAVVSIPVAMDGRTRVALRDAMLQAGINVVQFVHEPLAALYAYLKDQSNVREKLAELNGKLVLVFDWGGGTLDLTVCQIAGGIATQVMNVGDNEVGGDFVDNAIRQFVIDKHFEENDIQEMPEVMPGAKAKLLEACERAKISLSEKETALMFVDDYFQVDEDWRDIEVMLDRSTLNKLSQHNVNRGLGNIEALLAKLNIDQRQIALCLATGGMINMPSIRQRLEQLFSIERLEISKKGDRIISEGCAWIASDGLRVSLAKPVEVVEARQSYYTVFREGTLLPREGDVIRNSIGMYCADPRDGKAKFQIVRPKQLSKRAAGDPRETYTNLTVAVEPGAKPLRERLELNCSIDDNFILKVDAFSSLIGDSDQQEIYDLEFALTLPDVGTDDFEGDSKVDLEVALKHTKEIGAVQARSNVIVHEGDEPPTHSASVPGELLYKYEPGAFDTRRMKATKLQEDEKLFYQPCSVCGLRFNHPDCRCGSTSLST